MEAAPSTETNSNETTSNDSVDVGQLLQIKAMYELTTGIATDCFKTCISRVNPRLDESEKNCMSNCAANYLHMKLLFARRILESAKSHSLSN